MSPHPNTTYRPDIDGLRCLAVLSVVAFHAFPTWIRGGFIGVDVFFVISGYLISSVILTDLEQNQFSFVGFYRNRIRRIFPALGLVLFSCALGGWYLLPQGEFARLGKHIAGGAGFIANFVLWSESGYFDAASDSKPLVHLWSLGIEEQFYLVWPFVLWLSWKRRRNVLVATGTVLLISFVLNILLERTNAVANFYSPATRIWELLIGASFACLKGQQRRSLSTSPRLANLLGIAGISTILLAELVLTKDGLFPGWALLPTLGAGCLIAAGPHSGLNRRFLSHPALVWVGLISYPLYLWHWPVLTFLRIAGAIGSEVELATCAVSAAFILSWLTYRFVERPLRYGRTNPSWHARRPARTGPNLKAAGLLAAMVLAAILGAAIYRTDGELSGQRFKVASLPPLPDKSTFEELKIYEHYDTPNTSCRDKLGMAVLPEEVCITNSSDPKVLFIGDSHAMGLYSAVYANRLAIPSVLIASPGCLTYPSLVYVPNGKEWGQNCTDIARKALEYAIRSTAIDTVIVSLVRKGDHPQELTKFRLDGRQLNEREALERGTDHLIRSLLESGKNVIYVIDVPYFKDTPESCQSKFLVSKTDLCVVDRAKVDAPFAIYFEALRTVKERYPAMKVFNAADVLCKRDACAQHDGSQYYYIDKDHLSVHGSETILASLFRQFPFVQ